MRNPALAAAWCTGVVLLPWLCPLALAERADRQKPIHVSSDRMSADDVKRVAVFQGRVIVTQGTFTLCADQLTMREDKEGNQSGSATGNPASFREKREGIDEWIEGEAQRIEYDAKNEVVELFTRAKVNQGKDEIHGNYISYDAKTEFIKVQSDKEEPGVAGTKEQVTAVFNPKPKPGQPGTTVPQPSPSPPATLQPNQDVPPSPVPSTGQRPNFCR